MQHLSPAAKTAVLVFFVLLGARLGGCEGIRLSPEQEQQASCDSPPAFWTRDRTYCVAGTRGQTDMPYLNHGPARLDLGRDDATFSVTFQKNGQTIVEKWEHVAAVPQN